MSRKLHRPVLDTTGIVVPIKQGGSSADTLTQGAIALEMLTLDQIDLANRIPSLDATGHLSDTVVPAGLIFDSLHLEGPEIVTVNGTAKIYITDYDQYKTYVVSASAGFAAHSDGVIYFKAPSTTGPVTITVNDRDYTLTVDDKFIVKPSFILPTEDLANAGSALLAVSDDFEVYGVPQYRSLRFRGVNNFIHRTPIVSGNRTTWTWSGWVKRSESGAPAILQAWFDINNRAQIILGGGVNWTQVESGAIVAQLAMTETLFTANAHRHLVVVFDTGNATANDRMRIYVDNVLITSFSTRVNPTLNYPGTINQNLGHWMGLDNASADYLSGYLSEVHFVDGQALTPAAFGEIDADLGIWVPKVYEGTYGTNGFYLDFSDPSTLTDLCKDRSGNHHHWVPVNMSVSAGHNYDSMLDSVVNNYITLDEANKSVSALVDGAALGISNTLASWQSVAAIPLSGTTGKFYFEATLLYAAAGRIDGIGVSSIVNINGSANYYVGQSAGNAGLIVNQTNFRIYNDSVERKILSGTPVVGDIIGIAFDKETGGVWFSRNGTWFEGNPLTGSSPTWTLPPGNLMPMVSSYNSGLQVNFGQRPFSYTPPAGFKALSASALLHTSTDWQLSDDADFSTVISESLLNTTKLTSWPVSDLDVDKDYFLRCRYHGSVYGQSEWSDVRHIKTRSSWLPVNEQQILTAADKVAADNFGIRVSISADGTRLVVGAYFADPSGLSAAGKAYIYVKTGGVWVQEAILTASDKATNDYFGVGVSICADGTRVAIGAYNKTVGGLASAGAVYVFSRSGSTWTQEAILTASDKAAADQLGQGLAIDATGTRVVAGALESGANNAGAAYVFSRSGTVWAQEAKLTASDGASIDYLGLSASITANGDRVLVSSYGADVGGTADAGAAYVFVRSGTSWTQEAKLSASDKAVSDNFSFRVNISSDGTRAIIGAHNADPSGVASAGKAYIFIRSGSTWSEEAILTASNKAANDLFGADVNISSDGSIAAVAAYSSEFAGYTDCGVVYLFTRTGSTWSQQAILSASDKGNTSYFGHSLDMDETASTLLIGALNASPSGVAGAGSAYIFS